MNILSRFIILLLFGLIFQTVQAGAGQLQPAPAAPVAENNAATAGTTESPVASQSISEKERLRSIMIMVVLVVLVIALIILVFILIRGSRDKPVVARVQEAILDDPHGHTEHRSYKLGKYPTILGRVADAEQEYLNYIVVPESTIGRRHAMIEYKDYAYWIIDQGSINGTYVNNQLVTSETRLRHGDTIRLHKLEFKFLMPGVEDADQTVAAGSSFSGSESGTGEQFTETRSEELLSGLVAKDELARPDFDLTGGYAIDTDTSNEDTMSDESVSVDENRKDFDTDDNNDFMLDGEDPSEDPWYEETLWPDRDEDSSDGKK